MTRRITTTKTVTGRYGVRYGTPTSFDHLGYVERDGNVWTATNPDGDVVGTAATRSDAIAMLAS